MSKDNITKLMRAYNSWVEEGEYICCEIYNVVVSEYNSDIERFIKEEWNEEFYGLYNSDIRDFFYSKKEWDELWATAPGVDYEDILEF